MNQMEVVEEFQSRSRAAHAYREAAALLFVLSIVLFAVYGIAGARIGIWGGVALAAGAVSGAATLVLAVMSYARLRCPNCDRVLGEVRDAAYCPSCGAVLKTDTVGGSAAAGPSDRRPGERQMARRAASSSAAKAWEPRSGTRGIDDFPGEAYPKNIRMFTTPNEMELTKRYIQLIDKDNRNLSGPESARLSGRASKTVRNLLPEKISPAESGLDGIRRPHGILGFLSLESIIAIAAGGIILTVILMVAFGALG